MPEHSTWLTFALGYVKDTLSHNAASIGDSFIGHVEPTWQSFEPITASAIMMLLVLAFAMSVRGRLAGCRALIPDERLTLVTFAEAFLEYFYDLAKSVMDADRAKKYFPLIGTAAIFVFFSNLLALIPGMPVATSNLNVTMGTALVVFVLFNYYGLRAQGMSYITHLFGP